jgi:hypothetical protein
MTLAGQQLAAELYDPAVGTITQWLADGEAGEWSRYGVLPQQVLELAQADPSLREDIALETFIAALPPFLRKLDRGAYDATRGASIQSFFIGACRNRMGDVIRAHHSPLIALRPDTDELLAALRVTIISYAAANDHHHNHENAWRQVLFATQCALLAACEVCVLREGDKQALNECLTFFHGAVGAYNHYLETVAPVGPSEEPSQDQA